MSNVVELFPRKASAQFSSCGQYRYVLEREWDKRKPMFNFIMLNPSKAGETWDEKDPTVTRQIERTMRLGGGSLVVTNIFALISTDPEALYGHADPIGPDNNNAIIEIAGEASMVICGWGNHGTHMARGAEVLGMLLDFNITPHYLRMTKKMQPQHPLYLKYDIEPLKVRSA